MKKIAFLAIAVFVLILSSCERQTPDTMLEEKCVIRKTTRVSNYEDGTTLYARHFKYNGHCYIEFFRNLPSYDNYTGYVHDPDCPCMKK